ncbi:MAG: outer membrane protein assembly factor BamD [Alphaproteobacteria bacterium]|nr:outer membrane protein assembly factor BamD [Alphaproteobacteria bacterium]
MINKTTRLGASLLVMGVLAACGAEPIDDEAIAEKNESVDALYDKAFNTLNSKEYKPAIEKFEEVERQHPYSPWASQAQVMAAYSAYRGGYYEDAIVILDRFVKLHPTHKAAPYAYYLKALCYYIQITDVGRDQKMTEEARQALKDVIARYPDSEYAQDAKLKLDLTSDHLAGKEMEIGRYYLERDEYAAAVSRFKYVVDSYETTSHIPEALHRLVECYLRLGVVGEAKKYAAVLGHNFPGSDWYQYSYKMIKGNLSPEEKEDVFDKYLKVL